MVMSILLHGYESCDEENGKSKRHVRLKALKKFEENASMNI